MNHNRLLRLLIVIQTFLLFAVMALPLLVHSMHQTLGKCAYGLLSALCIIQAVLLYRALNELEM